MAVKHLGKGIRKFASGATRDIDEHKLDYEGFNCPLVKEAFAEYMHKHRKLSDGSLRDGDNWQKGIPTKSAMQSLLRHIEDLHKEYHGYESRDGFDEALGGILFNANVIWRNKILSTTKQKAGRKPAWITK